MHSAQWVPGTEVAGRRVAVVGTGASAFQLVPAIAPEASHVTVFQRSPVWMFPNTHYHEGVSAAHQWVLVSTAHPAKFREIVEPLVGRVEVPENLRRLYDLPSSFREIEPTLAALRAAT